MRDHVKPSVVIENDRLAGRRLKTLVVDDEPELADITAELLTFHDIDVLIAYSAREAILLLETHQDIDALFSDVMMPDMTGLELADAAEKLYPAMKIILTSGVTAPAYREQQTRRHPLVAKPYSIDTVVRLLKP